MPQTIVQKCSAAIAKLVQLSMVIVIVFLCVAGSMNKVMAANSIQIPGLHTINTDISSEGSLDLEQLYQVAQQGFSSVLNLRMSQEDGFLEDEANIVVSFGMTYAHVPVNPAQLSDALVTQVFEQIDALPKPILVHCSTGLRATGMALLHQNIHNDISLEHFFEQAKDLGVSMGDRPVLQQFFTDYITRYSAN